MKSKIIECFNNIGIYIDEIEGDLIEYYSDSIIFISFIIELEQMFDIEIPSEYLKTDNFRTIETIEQIINKMV